MTSYRLHLVPENGPTTTDRTEREFLMGYNFRIVISDLLSLPRGTMTTADDVRTMAREYAVDFDLTFKTLTAIENLEQEATHCYVAEQAVELYRSGGFKL